MSIERKADSVLDRAKKMAETSTTWADFSALLFSYPSGLVPQTFPDETERQAFFASPQYEQINRILIDLMKKFGVVAGATPAEKSGKFVVRVPKTIHRNLEIEAKAEGVSLNQLAVSKLSVPLKEAVGSVDAAKRKAEITAIVVNGILKPDAPLPFPDRTRVKVTIEAVASENSSLAAWT